MLSNTFRYVSLWMMICLLLLMTAPIALAQDNNTTPTWTIMVYMATDNNTLEDSSEVILNELEFVGSQPHMTIVAQVDGMAEAESRRYILETDFAPVDIASPVAETLDEPTIGEGDSLVDFVSWAMTTAPADHYAVIIVGEGMAWQGMGVDRAVDADWLDLAELDEALGTALAGNDLDAFDLIGLDAPYMGTYDVYHVLASHADFALTNASVTPDKRWNYTDALYVLVDDPELSVADFGRGFVEGYLQLYTTMLPTDSTFGMGMGDLSQFETFDDSLDALVETIEANPTALLSIVPNARQRAYVYTTIEGLDAVDLKDFLTELQMATEDEALADALLDVQTALADLMVYYGGQFGNERYLGELSVYLPPSIVGGEGLNALTDAQSDSAWGRFVQFVTVDILPTLGAGDVDADAIVFGEDNCPVTYNPNQFDSDQDGIGEVCDTDLDDDGALNFEDNCPFIYNPNQADEDRDNIGNICEADTDEDGFIDDYDVCPLIFNPDQADEDGDGIGDVCEPDSDGDNIIDDYDVCVADPNTDQYDSDGDGVGNICDPDNDNDGIINVEDNCPDVPNTSQENNDGDIPGDACDPDDDNDGVLDLTDNCQFTVNPLQEDNYGGPLGDACEDTDADTIIDSVDNCPVDPNTDQANNDGDAQGDVCDPDDDNDTVLDATDNCQFVPNTNQANNDGDAEGDLCDPDDDNDGVLDVTDNCQFTVNPSQVDNYGGPLGDHCDDTDTDTVLDLTDNCPIDANTNQANNDGDAQGDVCDPDDDNDGVLDVTDNCQFTVNPAQANNDGDAQGDLCDPDDDNDGVNDGGDNCQFIANAGQQNNDGDAQGDACDPDDDNDGINDGPDDCEFNAGIAYPAPYNGCPDGDGDGIPDAPDNCPATPNAGQANNDGDAQGDACDPDDDNDGINDGPDDCPFVAGVPYAAPNNGCPDGDGDGIPDAPDNCAGIPNPAQTDTDFDGQGDVCDADDDNDGLTDADETGIYGTNPLLADTDGGGTDDGTEVLTNGTDPLNPADD